MPQTARPPDLDASGRPVSAGDEPAFQAWYARQARQQGLNPDPDAPGQAYDYRAAFRAGATPDRSGHWPSQFKQAGHPNEVVGGFNTRTGERVPGTERAKNASELARLGWDKQTAARLAASPEPSGRPPDLDADGRPIGRAEASRRRVLPPGGPAVVLPPGQLPEDATAGDIALDIVKGYGQRAVGAVKAVGTVLGKYRELGPDTMAEGAADILYRGRPARGARRLISGAGVTVAPAAIPALTTAMLTAPVATTATIAGTGAVGVGVQRGVEAGGEALGLSPDQAGLVGDIAGIAAGGAVAKYGPAAVQQAKAAWTAARRTKAGAQSVVAFTQAIPASKSTPYAPADLHRASPYLDVEHSAQPINSVVRLRDAADNAIEAIESHVSEAVRANPNDLIRTNPLAAVRYSFRNAPRSDDLAKGMKALESLDLDQPLTITRADQLRHRLNAEMKAILKQNNYDVATARTADPAFTAKEAAARSLRDGVYRQLDARGAVGIQDLRHDEGSLIKIRNAAERQSFVGEKRVSGTAQGGPIGAARQAAAIGIRATPVPAMAADPLAKLIRPQNIKRDDLIAKAFSLRVPAPAVMPTIAPPPVIRGALTTPAVVTPPPVRSSGRVYDQPIPVVHPGGRRALPSGVREEFHLPGEVQADPSGRIEPFRNAPIDYGMEAGVNVKPGGFWVKQFSSDPDAAAAAIASPEVRSMLQRMKLDFEELPYQPGHLETFENVSVESAKHFNRPNVKGGGHYTEAAAGTRVGDDVRAISGWGKATNPKILEAVKDLLAGKMPTNRLHVAALDAAMGYLEKRPGYRGPELPEGFSRGSSVVDEDEVAFKAFSDAVDDLAKD